MSDHYHLPYEPIPDGPINLDITGHFVDRVHLRSAVMDTPIGRLPLIVFNFESSADPRHPLIPIIYAGPPEAMRSLLQCLTDTINGAITAATTEGPTT